MSVYLLRDLPQDRILYRDIFSLTASFYLPVASLSRDGSTDISHVNYFARLVKILRTRGGPRRDRRTY